MPEDTQGFEREGRIFIDWLRNDCPGPPERVAAIVGASGEPGIPGLGFRYDTDPRWGVPNPTGRTDGTFHAFCPPRLAAQSSRSLRIMSLPIV